MSVIFNGLNGNARGRVVALPIEDFSPGLLEVDGWEGFKGFKSIFTRVLLGGATNHQFQHTIGERIYLCVFGNRMGMMGLSGLSFFETCDDAGGSIGVSRVIDYFQRHRLSSRAEPLRVTIDPTRTVEAYLHSLQCEAVSTAATVQRMYQFHMTLAMPPSTAGARG